jgi:hypothetical protein
MHRLPSWPVRGVMSPCQRLARWWRLLVSHAPRIVTCSAVVPVVWFQALVSGCCPAVDWIDSWSLGGGCVGGNAVSGGVRVGPHHGLGPGWRWR